MISITNKIKLKRNVKVSKKDGKTVVSNETDKKGFIVFAKIIYCKKKMYKLTSSISTLDGDGCQVKLLNRKLRVVENIDPNSVNYFDDINKITFVGITVFPHTTIKINEINIEYEYDKEQDISKNFNGDILLLCPGYPTYDNKYRCAFIHSRMQAYKKENLKVDLAVVNENCINKSSISKFENIKVVANLPYYITTPIIMKLLENRLKIESITIMIQKEVADRLIEIPSGKNTGAITYTVYYYCECEKIREVENICFVPMPEVTSEVINLRLRKEPAVKVENKKVFFNIIKSAFMQRRKTLLNALVNTGVFKSKEEGAEILRKLNLREDIRAEKLTIEDFARICNYFCESIK